MLAQYQKRGDRWPLDIGETSHASLYTLPTFLEEIGIYVPRLEVHPRPRLVAIVYIRALYIVGTSIIGPLMAVLLPRFETRVVLRTFFASNACTICMDYFAFRAVTRVQAYRLNLPARVETRFRPWLFRPENVYFLSSLLAVPNITVLYSLISPRLERLTARTH